MLSPARSSTLAAALLACSAASFAAPIPGFSTATPYYIHYGNWDATRVANSRNQFKLVIVEALSNIARADVASIQSGPDQTAGTSDDVIVLGYISIGEDDRSVIFNNPALRDTILPTGGIGPSRDPRANPATDPIASTVGPGGVPSLGIATNGGYARFYLDADNDSLPDRNAQFGGAYVNAGDPEWQSIIRTMTVATQGRAGLDELLTTTVGKGLGCDGIFMDTIETCAPNAFGFTQYEWTTPGYQDLIANIAADYPDAILCQNRGIFFFSPAYEHYRFSSRGDIGLFMYESYYTDSNGTMPNTPSFMDNKHNMGPKINAESDRADGFSVIALGYEEPFPLPPAVTQAEFAECHAYQGWALYQTTPTLDAPMNFRAATWNVGHPDTIAPEWDSTAAGFVPPAGPAPTPRVGVQEAVAGDGLAIVRWDVARDQTKPVRYNIYHSDVASPGAVGGPDWTKIALVTGTAPENYANVGPGEGRYANEYAVSGLANGVVHRFAVRAEDALGHEDANSNIVATIPYADAGGVHSAFASIAIDGSFGDWPSSAIAHEDMPGDNAGAPSDIRRVWVANDAANVYVRIDAENAHDFPNAFNNIYVDADFNANTGFDPFGLGAVGSEMLMQGASLYSQGDGGFNNGFMAVAAFAPVSNASATSWEFSIPRSLIHPGSLTGPLANQPVFGADGTDFSFFATSDNAGNPAEFAPSSSTSIHCRLAAPPVSGVDCWAIVE